MSVLHGDCIEQMATLPEESVHAVVTDPPYHFGSIVKRFAKSGGADRPESRVGAFNRHAKGFMGKEWDGGDIAFRPETWSAAARTMKPGAHLAAFGSSKGFHRLAVAIEDAGFEIRDTLMWVYGQGFPKSHNQDGEWSGWGTALKPAWEPIILARKPLDGTVAENLRKHGTGAINIAGCRVASAQGTEGRWPANLLHDGSQGVVDAFPHAPGQLGALTGHEPSPSFSGQVYGKMARSRASTPRGDSGSAARFFYCAKATRSDRNDGLEGLPEKPLLWSSGTQNPGSFQAAGTKKSAQNNHPTVKPTELMRWLCRLITPPGGTVLDPFMGSGSTGRAAVLEGFNFVGIERDAEYLDIAQRRIAASERAAFEALLG